MYKLKVPYNPENPGDAAQLECLKRALTLRRFGVFFQQRVGKTRVGIDFAGYNIAKGAKRVLVLCPLCAQQSWRAQFKQYMGATGFQTYLHVVKNTKEPMPKTKDAYVMVCTYDKASLMKDRLMRWQPDIIILDEVHLIKNRTSRRSKTAWALARKAKGVLGLTGTPYSNKKYVDLFGIFRAVNPNVFGERWVDFENKYCIMGGYMGYEVVGYKDEQEILELVAQNSMRVVRQDVMAEPEQEDIEVLVQMSQQELDYYKAMQEESVLYLEDEPKVTADMIMTQRTKLQQITGGTIKQDDGELRVLGNSKLEATLDLIDTIDGKVIVVCRYVADIHNLVANLKDKCQFVTGSLSENVRLHALDLWHKQPKTRVLVVQEQTMSMGVDLSIASDMIFYSWGPDSVTHSQVRDRVVGRNQASDTVHYHYMICEDTIDTSLYKALKENVSFAEQAANWRKWICSN